MLLNPINSDVEAKLRRFLVELGNADRILGIQVCAYKDGKVIIDTSAGVLGIDDPRPVQPDSLFNVFSVTKGITAGLVHWLADKGTMNNGPTSNAKWLYDSPINSDVEAKLRHFLVEMGNADRILGIQVCAYKDGKVIIDTSAGVLGIDDPCPVQPDSLFNVFSVTKDITAGLVHWLADKGAGLQNVLAGISNNDPDLYYNFDECLKRIAMVAPETEPGTKELYHYLSFGWLCGGIIERASGKKYQEVLEEAFTCPLGIEGEFYIGIPPGIKESRLATLTTDAPDFNKFATFIESQKISDTSTMPSSFTFSMLENLVPLSNTLSFRRAIQPAVNAHVSARALARYYDTLADGGVVPTNTNGVVPGIFTNPKDKIHDAIMGNGDYNDLILPGGSFGLGFHRIFATNGSLIGFGLMGFSGSTG
ncbi:beta-lactamase domain-containing protein 2-like protein [Tanacetum coccineum]